MNLHSKLSQPRLATEAFIAADTWNQTMYHLHPNGGIYMNAGYEQCVRSAHNEILMGRYANNQQIAIDYPDLGNAPVIDRTIIYPPRCNP